MSGESSSRSKRELDTSCETNYGLPNTTDNCYFIVVIISLLHITDLVKIIRTQTESEMKDESLQLKVIFDQYCIGTSGIKITDTAHVKLLDESILNFSKTIFEKSCIGGYAYTALFKIINILTLQIKDLNELFRIEYNMTSYCPTCGKYVDERIGTYNLSCDPRSLITDNVYNINDYINKYFNRFRLCDHQQIKGDKEVETSTRDYSLKRQSLHFKTLPKILIINLAMNIKRTLIQDFDLKSVNIDKRSIFTLTIFDNVKNPVEPPVKYNLFGVMCRDEKKPHIFAIFSKDDDRKGWRIFDNEDVTKCIGTNFIDCFLIDKYKNAYPYILFYVKDS